MPETQRRTVEDAQTNREACHFCNSPSDDHQDDDDDDDDDDYDENGKNGAGDDDDDDDSDHQEVLMAVVYICSSCGRKLKVRLQASAHSGGTSLKPWQKPSDPALANPLSPEPEHPTS